MSITNLISKLLVASKGCSNYYTCFSDWFNNQVEKGSRAVNKIINGVNDPILHLEDDDLRNINILYDGKYISGIDVVNSLYYNDFAIINNQHEDVTDKVVDSLKSGIQSNSIYAIACDVLDKYEGVENLAPVFLQRTDSIDLNDGATAVRSYLSSILADTRMSKADMLYNIIASLNIKPSQAQASSIWSSPVFEATGVHPGMLWCIETFDIDMDTMLSKIQGVLTTVGYAIGSLLQTSANLIVKLDNWIRSSWKTDVLEGGEIYDVSSDKGSRIDNVVDNGYIELRWPVGTLGKQTLSTTCNIPISDIDNFYALMEGKPLIKMDTPFASIYTGHFEGVLGDTLRTRIYPKMVSQDDFYNLGYLGWQGGDITTCAAMVELWAGYSGSGSVGNTGNSRNQVFYENYKRGRQMLNVWATLFAEEYYTGSTPSLALVFGERSQGMADDPSTYVNNKVYRAMHRCKVGGYEINHSDDGLACTSDNVYVLNVNIVRSGVNVGNVNDAFKSIIRAVIAYGSIAYADQAAFAPYTVENGFYKSRFHVRSDVELVDNFGNQVKAVGYVALAVIVTAVLIKVTKSIRLAYQAAEVAYWQAINSGNAQNAVKAARKSKFLSKLCGLSSVSGGSAIMQSLASTNSQDVIVRLITT